MCNDDSCNSVICSEDEEQVDKFQINDELTDEHKNLIKTELENWSQIFSDVPGRIGKLSYKICVDPNVKPISSLPYKIPYPMKDKVKETLDS